MPITLNGTYHTMEDMAKLLGRTHSIICRWTRQLGLRPLRIQGQYLLNDEEKAELERYAERISLCSESLTLGQAATQLGISLPRLIEEVEHGHIPCVRDATGKPRLEAHTIQAIAESEARIGRGKVDWMRIRELFNQE